MAYARHFGRETDQRTPLPGMVKNSAGGTAYPVDNWTRLSRFLILGADGGTYYINEKTLTIENAKAVIDCLEADSIRAIKMIVDVSNGGRAPKNDPAIFALAIAASYGLNQWTKSSKSQEYQRAVRILAFDALPKVCRIGTHLFQFMDEVSKLRGTGMGLRKAIRKWYSEKDDDKLGYQLIKYQGRHGWTHRDVLRVAHDSKLPNRDLLGWAVGKRDGIHEIPDQVAQSELLKNLTPKEGAKNISRFRLPREVVPTEWLNDVAIWDVLLQDMPITAMIRNLGKMTQVGLLKPMSDASATVTRTLRNEEVLRKGRVHPLSILMALVTYNEGHGMRGSLTWEPVPQIMEALEDAFYLAFDSIEPTGKRHYIGLDVSGSMNWPISNSSLTCAQAAAALCMVTARTEDNYFVGAFADGGGSGYLMRAAMKEFPITRKWDLNKVIREAGKISFGGTDCALPMIHAAEQGIEADVFIVLTDSETWAGRIQPVEALQKYRDKTGIPAKLVVVGMEGNEFSIADPDDAGMMDCVGMDTTVPSVIRDFVLG